LLFDKCSEHALRVADDFGKTALNYASDSADNALIDMVYYGYDTKNNKPVDCMGSASAYYYDSYQ